MDKTENLRSQVSSACSGISVLHLIGKHGLFAFIEATCLCPLEIDGTSPDMFLGCSTSFNDVSLESSYSAMISLSFPFFFHFTVTFAEIFFSSLGVFVLVQAQDFRQQGTKMRRKMWIQNMKIKLIVLGIIVALILIIILSICHGFKC